MILFCNLACVCVYKLSDMKFNGCKKSFSWFDQKVKFSFCAAEMINKIATMA